MKCLGKVRDFLWPRHCAVCGHASDRPDRYFCTNCLNLLPFMPTRGLCRKCGRDAYGLDGEFLCQDCRESKPTFDRVGCTFRFESEARDVINAFKFRSNLWLKDDFVDCLEATVRTRFKIANIGCVSPVPSTLSHRILRGFNPCDILSKGLARRLGKPCAQLMRRTGHPQRQGSLTEDARKTNVIGTVAVRGKVDGVVLVVDDIMTTGATMRECAKVLKEAGAKSVWGVALGRSVRV